MGDVPDESARPRESADPDSSSRSRAGATHVRGPGVYGLGQPVMQPVYPSRALHDILIASAHLGAAAQRRRFRRRTRPTRSTPHGRISRGSSAADATAEEFWDRGPAHMAGSSSEAKPARCHVQCRRAQGAIPSRQRRQRVCCCGPSRISSFMTGAAPTSRGCRRFPTGHPDRVG